VGKTSHFRFLNFSPHLERPGDEQVYIANKESAKKPVGTKSFVQIEINAVFTSTSGKMQFRSGVFDHFKNKKINLWICIAPIPALPGGSRC
jgi:hypothetical protein